MALHLMLHSLTNAFAQDEKYKCGTIVSRFQFYALPFTCCNAFQHRSCKPQCIFTTAFLLSLLLLQSSFIPPYVVHTCPTTPVRQRRRLAAGGGCAIMDASGCQLSCYAEAAG